MKQEKTPLCNSERRNYTNVRSTQVFIEHQLHASLSAGREDGKDGHGPCLTEFKTKHNYSVSDGREEWGSLF